MDICPACIVVSAAGRDKGKYFTVVGVVDELYVLLCDGELRKIDKPKRKKIKHVKSTGLCSSLVKEKLISGEKITDSDIRNAQKSVLLKENIIADNEGGFHSVEG